MIDSRPVLRGAVVRRRRGCTYCLGRFTTYERRTVREPKPAPPDPREVLHLRAALACYQRGDLPTEAGELAAAALARDWSKCAHLEALVIVILSADRSADAGPV